MTKVVDLASLPALKGSVIPPVAAVPLRVSRQRVFQMIEEGKIKSAVRVPGLPGKRPAAYLIRIAEVMELAVENCPDCQAAIAAGEKVPYCRHCDFGEQDIVYGDAEPVEHAVPHQVPETVPAQ